MEVRWQEADRVDDFMDLKGVTCRRFRKGTGVATIRVDDLRVVFWRVGKVSTNLE